MPGKRPNAKHDGTHIERQRRERRHHASIIIKSYNYYNYLPLPIFAESRLRRPVGAGNVYTPAPASPMTRTHRLMKRPTAHQGGARMERDCRARHHGRSVSIININITAIDCL